MPEEKLRWKILYVSENLKTFFLVKVSNSLKIINSALVVMKLLSGLDIDFDADVTRKLR